MSRGEKVSVSNLVTSNQAKSSKEDKSSQQCNRYKRLEFLDKIKLTQREIDVLSCILFGRSAKVIASYLSISPRTVEGYWDNLLKKLQCNSRQQIINKLEKSKNLEIFRQHYAFITQQSVFEKNLISLKNIFEIIRPKIKIIYEEGCIFLNDLERDFLKIGIDPSKEKSFLKNSELIVFEIEWKEVNNLKKTTIKVNIENLENNYFFCFFSLFKNLIPVASFQSLTNVFSTLQINIKEKENISDEFLINHQIKSIKQIKRLIPLLFLSLAILALALYAIAYKKSPEKYTFSNIENELIDKNFILDRPDLIKKIQTSLNSQNGIRVAMLIGPSGAGKTTLACHYAHFQKSQFIYKIKGTSRTDVITSFREMGYGLCKTKIDLEEFETILKILDSEDRRKKIIDFIRKNLLSRKTWTLIYDDLKNFDLIADYFPRDQNLWGSGTVLITTQNANLPNIRNFDHINAIYVKDLTSTESLLLFKKIIFYSDHSIALDAKILDNFLKKIPPFPLDIAIIAHYIKNTSPGLRISPEFLNGQIKNHEKDNSTRYNVMKATFQQILRENHDFQELLVLCAFISSHKIPLSLLTSIKKDLIVSKYINLLNRYSLITDQEFSKDQEYYFSIHQTTKNCLLEYLIRELKLQKNSPILKLLIKKIVKYSEEKINKDQFQRIELFLPHLECLASQTSILSLEDIYEASFLLGYTHLYLRNYDTAKSIFEKNLEKIGANSTFFNLYNKNSLMLGVTYRYLGDFKTSKLYLERGIPYNSSPMFAKLLLEKARLYRAFSEYDLSRSLLEQGLGIFTKQFPNQYTSISSILTNLGTIHRMAGNYSEAVKFFQQSLQINNEKLKNKRSTYAWLLTQMGMLERSLGNYLKSKELLLKSSQLYKEQFPEDKEELAHVLTALSYVYDKLEEKNKSLLTIKESMDIYRNSVNHSRNAWNIANLGIIERKQGNLKEAKVLLKKAEDIFSQNFSKIHVERGWVLIHLGIVARESGEYKKALNYFKEGLDIFKTKLPPDHSLISWELMQRALTYLSIKDYRNATTLAEKSYEQFTKIFGTSSHKVSEAGIKLAEIYIKNGQYKKAREILKLSLDNFDRYYKIKTSFYHKRVKDLLFKIRKISLFSTL